MTRRRSMNELPSYQVQLAGIIRTNNALRVKLFLRLQEIIQIIFGEIFWIGITRLVPAGSQYLVAMQLHQTTSNQGSNAVMNHIRQLDGQVTRLTVTEPRQALISDARDMFFALLGEMKITNTRHT